MARRLLAAALLLAATHDGVTASPVTALQHRDLRMTIPGIPTVQTQTAGNHGNAGVDPKAYRCVLDPKITPETLPFFEKDIRMAWGSLCSRNRGIFVTNPPDGHTYGCDKLPSSWSPATTVNELTNQTLVPSSVAVQTIDKVVKAVFFTTPNKDAGSCDFESISTMLCGREEPWKRTPWYPKLRAPIRSVNIGGLFVLERWILPGFVKWGNETGIMDQHSFSLQCGKLGNCNVIKEHWKNFYTAQDFMDMKEMNLNSIRLPVGWWYFAQYAGISSAPYILPDEDLYDPNHPITMVIKWANDAGLQVILDLHGAPGGQNGLDNSGITSPDPNNMVWGETWLYSPKHIGNTVKVLAAVAQYINHINDNENLDNIMALELLNEPWAFLDIARVRDFYVSAIEAVRLVRPHLPIIIHDSFRANLWTTLLKDFPYPDVFMDTHVYHGFTPSDVASDNPKADRQKMYTHERMACGYGAVLRYQTCSTIPVAVLEWSLAIDNCMPSLDAKKVDFGQCNNINSRLTDSWWTSHIRSFAMRQIAVFEKELGWAFWCWKLDNKGMTSDPNAAFWSFKLAVHRGYIDTKYPNHACMHPPAEDWDSPQIALPSAPTPAPAADSDRVDEGSAPAPTEASAPGESPETSSSSTDKEALAVREAPQPQKSPESAPAYPLVMLVLAMGLMVGAVAVALRKRAGAFPPAALSINGVDRSGYDTIDAARASVDVVA